MTQNKKNLFIILAIFILPIVLYTTFKAPSSTVGAAMSTGKPKVIEFSSPLCMECKELAKVLKVVEPKYEDKIDFVKINVNSGDETVQELVTKYKVTVVPTTVYLNKQGKMVKRTEGSMPKAELEKILDDLVDG